MKIDVEGAETEVLQGMGKYLADFSPTILMEILSGESGANIQKIVEPCNYIFFRLNRKNKPEQTLNITASDDFNYLLCQPDIARQLGLMQ